MCTWGYSTGDQQSCTAEVCVRYERCGLLVPSFTSGSGFRALACPQHAGRLWSWREVWFVKPQCLFFLGFEYCCNAVDLDALPVCYKPEILFVLF